MTIRNLDSLFRPASVALIGIGEGNPAMESAVADSLLHSGFKGRVCGIGMHEEGIQGLPIHAHVEDLPEVPELAVLICRPELAPGYIDRLGRRGTRAAVVLGASDGVCEGEHRVRWHTEMLNAARPHMLRILGPNSPGVSAAEAGLHASIAPVSPLSGGLAFVAQCGAVQSAVLDWATSRNVGFSHLIGLGDMIDVDFGDVLDYLALESPVKAILIHMEAVTDARKFMSAARAAARMKPVLVVKTGRGGEGARAAALHTGVEPGTDGAYEAAFCRAGMLRVRDLQELFAAVQTLGTAKPARGNRLAILTNGGGMGVLAADAAMEEGAVLGKLSPEIYGRLETALQGLWSRTNPVSIHGEALPNRFAEALEILLDDKELDGILLAGAPSAIVSSTDTARAVVECMKKSNLRSKPQTVLTCWVGGQAVQEARRLLAENRIPTYESPGDAVRGFMHMVRYRRNQETLMEVPPTLPETFIPDLGTARDIIDRVLLEGRQWLTATEAKELLSAYQIPVVPTLFAETPTEAATLAAELRPPVALKILSPDIQRKSEVCGVALHLDSPEAVRETAQAMAECVRSARPTARLSGFTVQPMVHRVNPRELLAGAFVDPRFGPVIVFGHGGITADAIQDQAFALPPLNMQLARELMSRTRIHRVLLGEGGIPAAAVDAVAHTLVKISQLLVDFAEVAELEINPLLVDAQSVVAIDARLRVTDPKRSPSMRMAVRPYPKELEETLTLPDGQSLRIRPIRPEDQPAYCTLVESLPPEDIRMRFLHPMKALPPRLAARLTQVDYDREMALVVADASPAADAAGAVPVLHGSVRISADPDNERAEFAILLQRELTGVGLGPLLMRRIVDYARSRGIREVYGEVLSDNRPMISLCKAFGFRYRRDPDDPGILTVSLDLA